MVIEGDFFGWTEKNVDNISANPGVYELYDGENNLIYIGQSKDLYERFKGYWDSNFGDDICKRATKKYKREFTPHPKEREKELLVEYRNKTAKLPKCNDTY
jgi:excinuclease UvrABC nuclease subunit